MIKRLLVVALCLTAIGFAQQAQPPSQSAPRPRGGPGRGPWLEGPGGITAPNSEQRLTQRLGLNAAQQNTAHTAIEEAKVILNGARQQDRDLRTQLSTAIKTGDQAGIERVSQSLAQLHQQRTSTEAKALAKIYGSLSADQKTEMDRELNRGTGLPRGGRGPRPPRGTAAPNAPQGAQQ